jgi:hypothetical protein
MTQAQVRTYGLVIPSLFQLWLGPMLCALVELVLNVAFLLRMKPSRLPGECHTDATPPPLPEAGHDQQEKPAAAPDSQPIEALMVSSSRSERPSNHEGVLANASHAVAQQRDCESTHHRSFRLSPGRAGRESRLALNHAP